MKLFYFKATDTPEQAKARRNELIKKHHPDRALESEKAKKTK